MKLIVRGGRINHREFISLLNRVLGKYNIEVYGILEGESPARQVINIQFKLKEPVHYAPHLSQLYDRGKDEYFHSTGYYTRNPYARYGRKMPHLHFYHFALVNDTIAHIMETLKERGFIKEWELKSAVLTIKDKYWRRQFPYEYLPQYDPAFLRPMDTYVSFKSVKIPTRRDKALLLLESLNKYFESGKLVPADIPHLERVILKATETDKYVKEVRDKTSLWAEKPSIQAWMFMKYGNGEKADIAWKKLGLEEKEAVRRELETFLEKADPQSTEFKEYLRLFKERLGAIIKKYIEEEGVAPREVLQDTDAGGFPYGLARYLVHNIYVPPELESIDLSKLVEKTEEKRSVRLER